MKNKISYTTAIAIIVLIIVGGFVYFDYKEKNSTEWKTYTSEQFGFSFEYPVRWGDVIEKNNSTSWKPEDRAMFFNPQDINELITDKYRISFTRDDSCLVDWCKVDFEVRVFNSDRYVDTDCYEGSCDTANLLNDRDFVQGNYNKLIGDNRSYCQDSYDNRGGLYVTRYCRTYNNDIKIEPRMKYSSRNINIDPNNFSFDRVRDQYEDQEDFDRFLSDYERVLNSITFLN